VFSSTPRGESVPFGVPLPRWLLVFAALSIGCSGDDSVTEEEDAAADVDLDGTTDTAIDTGITVDSSIDETFDATVDSATDETLDAADSAAEADATIEETAIDSSPDTGADTIVLADSGSDAFDASDTAADTAIDTFFTPPTWSPVCVPVPSDASSDATSEAEAAIDALDDTSADSAADTIEDTADAATDEAGDADVDATTDAAPDGGVCTATRLRIVASNLTSGSASVYESPGIHILQGLHPDIALMQEFKYPGGMRALVDTAFGPTFRYSTETSLGSIPNGIVSRYPIVESGEWDDPDLTDRDFVWARIDIPGSIDLFAVSVHLRTTSSTARDAEAKNLVAYIKAKVPAGAYLVIGGDCNTALATEPALFDLAEVVTVGPPYASDQAGNLNTNAPRSKPYDWVLPNALLYSRMIPVSIGSASYPAGLIFDSRVYTPLSDVAPVISSDSNATNMQHMAVVRDFAVGD
jgi:hypothetical protein